MRGKHGFRIALAEDKISLEEVRIEIQAQLDWFTQNMGKKPLHVDGHQHVHSLPLSCP